MGSLGSVHPPPLLAFGIVDRDTPLPSLDEDHETSHHDRQRQQEQHQHDMQFAGARQFQGAAHRMRQARNDTGEDQHGNTVSNAAFGHLLAQPHQKHGAGHQRHRGGHEETDTRRDHHRSAAHRLTLQCNTDADRLEGRQHHRQVARVASQRMAAGGPTLLAQLFQRRHDHGHELQDDRGRDIGHHPERKQAQPTQGTA